MSNHPYRYRMLVEYLNPTAGSVKPDYAEESAKESLAGKLEEVVEHLPEVIAEGWEVNSHSLSVSQDTVILTVLLCRQAAS